MGSIVTNMGLGQVLVMVMMVLGAMGWGRVMAQSSCTNVIISLAPCLNYVSGSSSTPSSSCCSQLATVVRSQPQCLCAVLNGGGSSFGVTINQTLALALPDACHVQTPPVSRCNSSGGTSSPSYPPADSPEGLPGSKVVPATSGSSSSGGGGGGGGGSLNMNKPVVQLVVLFGLFMMATTTSTL